MDFLVSTKFFKLTAIAAVLFIIIDIFWIGFFASKMYAKELGFLAELVKGKVQFNLPIGLLVQAIISIGLSVFIIMSLQISNDLKTAVLTGAFLGFVMYCTFDITCLSFIKGWSVRATIIDIIWGTTQGLLAGIYSFFLWNKIL